MKVIIQEPKSMADKISSLRDFQTLRNNLMKQQNRINNAMRGILRWVLDWEWEMPEAERKAINNRAEKIAQAIEAAYKADVKKGTLPKETLEEKLKGEDLEVAQTYYLEFRPYIKGRLPLDKQRKDIERRMEKIAKTFPAPIINWVTSIRGMGVLGLALLIAEIGDPNDYDKISKIWKRMGVAVIDGERQGFKLKGQTEKGLAHGYCPRRRSVLWTIGDSLLKHQRPKNKPHGPYGVIYNNEKAKQQMLNPDKAKMFYHRRAQRAAEKRLLKHLWENWV